MLEDTTPTTEAMHDPVIDRLIRPPVRRCRGSEDPLGVDGEPRWDLTTRLRPRGQAERDLLIAVRLEQEARRNEP